MTRLTYIAAGFTAFAAFSAFAAPEPAKNTNVTLAAPPGITLRVIRIGYGVNPIGENGNQPRDRVVFANSKGMVLYTSDKDAAGKSNCTGDCAKTWPPVVASADAK